MKNSKKIFFLLPCAVLLLGFVTTAAAQDRQRVIKLTSSRPIDQPGIQSPQPNKIRTLSSSIPSNTSASRPTLTNNLELATAKIVQPLVKKTGSSSPVNIMAAAASKLAYSPTVTGEMLRSIQSKLGIRYLYGASGPNRYDCSGFVWSVFNDAGLPIERTSARTMWNSSEPVSGDDRFKFGTLVFFNSLGHVGIVADENGFYQASSSKGITYSKFEGYWQKRIVGFRRLIPHK